MNIRRIVMAGLIALLVAVPLCHPAIADYKVHVSGDQFRITWRINAMQNLTSFANTIAFPQNLNLTLTGNDQEAFATSLRNALQAKVASVQLLQPTISLSSNRVNATCSQHCAFQMLNATITFIVEENPSQAYANAQYDMSWVAIRLGDDLLAGGVSFNTIGSTYLLQGLASFFPKPSTLRSFLVQVGSLNVNKDNYQEPTKNIVLLDSSGFQTPVENWVRNQNLNNQTETWSSPRDAGFSVAIIETITEFDVTTKIHFYAVARVSAELSTPLGAFARGNTLFIDTSNGLLQKTAATIIVAVIGILVASLILERRLNPPRQRQRKKR